MCICFQNQKTQIRQDDLIPLPKEPEESWCSKRIQKNITSACLAGIISGGGSLAAGLIPTTTGIVLGSLTSGFANGLGVVLSWEIEDPQRRAMENQIRLLEQQHMMNNKTILELENSMEHFKSRIEALSK